MSTHLPGPWKVEEDGFGIDVLNEHSRVAAMYKDDRYERGNARLIAAAPDMLDALEYLVSWLEAGDHLNDEIDVARAAIKKATGEA